MRKNVLVLVTQKNSPQNEFCSGLEFELGSTYKIKYLEALGPNPDRIREFAEYGVGAKFDAIVTFGTMASMVTKKTLNEMSSSVPVFFSAVADPLGLGLIASYENSKNNFSGVGLRSSSNMLPAQFLLQSKPNTRNILLPYHPSERNGRLDYIAKEMKQYFAERKVKVHLLPVETVDQAVSLIKEQLNNVDSLMFIYGDTISEAYGDVVDDCEKQNVTIFANGKEALEKGAVFALRSDMKFAGVKLAQSIKECLEEGKKPSEIPFKLIDSNIRLAVNPAAAEAQGVVLASEILTAYDGKGYYEELPTYNIGIAMPETLLHADIVTGFYDAAKKESAIVCKRHTRYFPLYQGDTIKRAVIDYITHLLEEVKCEMLITADQFIDEVIETRNKLGYEYVPVINVIDGDLDPERYQVYREMLTGAPIVRDQRHRYQAIPHTSFRDEYKVFSVILPPKNRLTALEALQVIPDNSIKKILVPLYGHPDDKTVQGLIETLHAYGAEQGLSFTPLIHPHITDLEMAALPLIQEHDALLTYESWSNQQFVGKLYATGFFEEKVILGANIEEGFRRAAIAYGNDTRSLGDLLFTVTKKMVYNQVPLIELSDRLYHEVSMTIVNRAMCERLALLLPAGIEALLGNLFCVHNDTMSIDIPELYRTTPTSK